MQAILTSGGGVIALLTFGAAITQFIALISAVVALWKLARAHELIAESMHRIATTDPRR